MATFIKAGFWEKLCKPCRGYKGWLNLDQFVQDSARPYKIYTAVIRQIDTDAPEAIILENTLDETPVWSRDAAGLYKLSAVNEIFKTNKTICFIGHNYDTPLAIWQFGRGEGNGPDTERVVFLQVYSRASGTSIDISDAGAIYYDTYVEVRVYP